MTITDRQVRELRKLLAAGETLFRAAWRTGMDRKSARKYHEGKLPNERMTEPTWRTREDPFADVWEEVHEQLQVNASLQAKTLFEWLQRKHPGRFDDSQLRTFQRGVKRWRATLGPQKEIFFSQVHTPGRLCASDFTYMNDLAVTIQGQSFPHLLYHFVLTYSNWEWVTICPSESFESLCDGLQEALWKLGGVPERHRSDRMSAAVNNLSDCREFTDRYQALMDHYRMEIEKTNSGQGNENGDVESLHGHFKTAVDQALMLRGSRDFENQKAYASFLHELVNQKNANRQKRLNEELARLNRLPQRRLESFKRERVRVNEGSLIRIQKNVYSVHSRLIGEMVDVRIYADHLEIWYGQKRVETLPRLRGSQKSCVNYRHVIDRLVRKPGAFENYRYRKDLFPTTRFRMAYDMLSDRHSSRVASRQYLAILQLAARSNESAVDEALRHLISQGEEIDPERVQRLVEEQEEAIPSVKEVVVDEPDLDSFDSLLDDKEVLDGYEQECEGDVDWAPARASSSDLP